MVYTGIGDISLARKLAGSPTDGSGGTPTEVSTTDMEQAMEYGQDQLFLFTKKSNWDSNDTVFHQVCRIVEHFAASYLYSWRRDPDNKSQELYNRAKTMCTAIMEDQSMASDEPPQGISQTSVAYNYSTNRLNDGMARYKSPRVDI